MTLALGAGMLAPTLPVFARSFNVSFGEAATALIAYEMGQVVGTIPTGFLIDRIGRRRVLLAGPLILAATSVATGLSTAFVQLLIFRFIAGWAQQMWMLSRLTVIADTGAERQRGRQVMGMVGMEASGRLLGPAIGGFLALAFGIRVPFFLHALLCLMAIAPSFVMIKESTPLPAIRRRGAAASSGPSAGTIAALLTLPVLMFFLAQFLANFTRGTSSSGTLHLYAAYAFGVGPEVIGLLASAAGIVGLPIIFSTGFIMDRFGRTATVVPGFTLMGLSMFGMAVIAYTGAPFSTYVPAFLALQFSQSLTAGNMQVIGSLIAPEHVRGRFFGIWRLMGEAGSASSPIVFAFIAERVSYAASFAVLSLSALCAATVLWTQVKKTLKSRASPPDDTPAPVPATRGSTA
jgi:MFS family permease